MYEKSESIPQSGNELGTDDGVYDMLIDGWESQSMAASFLEGLRRLDFYREGLLYSGFDGEDLGTSSSSNEGGGIVYCSPEAEIEAGGVL